LLLIVLAGAPYWIRNGGDCVQTVLVLEDNASILELIRLVVEQNGYEVLGARSAQEAFEQFEACDGHADLLITDVTLPVSSGIRVALELRSLTPYLRIILISGYSRNDWNEQDTAELDELPSDSVITLQKPFVPAALLDSIHRLIGLPFVPAPALQMKVAG
jgi:CheY-like chemotaxis protein